MSKNKIFYISDKVNNQLQSDIVENLSSYEGDGFAERAEDLSWQIPLNDGRQYDLSALEDLSAGEGSLSEIENSLKVWRAMSNLSPMLASEPRIWARLSHVECFEYTRDRWVKSNEKQEKKQKSIAKHFFASGRTGYRDDHAIGRLWWNAYIANLMRPTDQKRALELILKTADIRSNLVERPLSFRRINLGKAILRLMERNPDTTKKEKSFRELMKSVNKFSGGVVWETLVETDCDALLDRFWADRPRLA